MSEQGVALLCVLAVVLLLLGATILDIYRMERASREEEE